MNIKAILKELACGGVLVSTASLLTDVGMASELHQSTATSAESRRPNLDPALAIQRATTATADGDDDTDDENRVFLFSKITRQMNKLLKSGEQTKHMRKVVPNEVFKRIPSDAKWAQELSWESFHRLRVGETGSIYFFTDPPFQTWTKETRKICGQNIRWANRIMYDAMLAHFGEEKITRLLIDSANPPQWLIGHQFDRWHRLDAEDVFKRLQLKRIGNQLLNSPELTEYVSITLDNYKDPHIKLWEVLEDSEGYSDAELVDMLRVPPVRFVAYWFGPRIKKLLLMKWKMNDYPIADVLRHLGLQQPEIDVWLAFARTTDQVPPEIFTSNIKFDDKKLAEMIGTVLLSKDSEKVSMGKSALQALNEKWKQAGLTGRGLFETLRVNEEFLPLNPSPLWTTWIFYLDYLDPKTVHTQITEVLKYKFTEFEVELAVATSAQVLGRPVLKPAPFIGLH